MVVSVEVSSMASSFCNPQILPLNSFTKKAVRRVVMVQSKDVTPKRICNFKFRLIAENKVGIFRFCLSDCQIVEFVRGDYKIYEDQERGIVCYRGGDGKVFCEGLDEGPRLQFPETRTFTDQKSGNNSSRGGIHEDPWYLLPERAGITDHQRELQILAFLDARFS